MESSLIGTPRVEEDGAGVEMPSLVDIPLSPVVAPSEEDGVGVEPTSPGRS